MTGFVNEKEDSMHHRSFRFRAIALLLFALGFQAISSGDDNLLIQPAGSYSNMQFTEEHAYGYTVEVWRKEHTVIGFFLSSEGLQGDTPTGLLDKVLFNPKTGQLSFQAKLTMGSLYGGPDKEIPTKDLYEFQGTLTSDFLKGHLKHSELAGPKPQVKEEDILLKKSIENSEMDFMGGLKTVKDFQNWTEVIKNRMPKW